MKKTYSFIIVLTLLFVFFMGFNSYTSAQGSFSQALLNCENYSNVGSVEYNGEIFNISTTLEKGKGKCVYKEKIFQNKKYQMLTCNFENSLLPTLSKSMEEYNNYFKKEIAKTAIYESKMTNNGKIFQKYLVDPKICTITTQAKN